MHKWIWPLFIASALTQTAQAMDSFKLYGEPHHVANPQCDRYTLLNLEADGEKGFAELVPSVGSTSSGSSAENPQCIRPAGEKRRAYALKLEFTDCGSVIYLAHAAGSGYAEITDHRKRLCNDAIPAPIVVKEADARGFESTWFSATE